MVRSLIRLGLTLLGNALGLWVASLVLDDMDVGGTRSSSPSSSSRS